MLLRRMRRLNEAFYPFGKLKVQREGVTMSIDRVVLAFAGFMIPASLVLSQLHHPAWLWLTGFVGANLLQSAFTGCCPLALVLRALGVRPGEAFH